MLTESSSQLRGYPPNSEGSSVQRNELINDLAQRRQLPSKLGGSQLGQGLHKHGL